MERKKGGENIVYPTKKQKEAFKKVIEEGKAPSAAMLEVGFSEVTAKNPKNLTESRGWEKLMDAYLNDEFLAEKHNQLLNKKETTKVFMHDSGEYERVTTEQPETQAVSKALDMAYKLKKRYEDKQSGGNTLNLTQVIIQTRERKKDE